MTFLQCEVCRDTKPANCPGCAELSRQDLEFLVIMTAQEFMDEYNRELYRDVGEARDEQ